jgi:acetyltransferase
MISNKLTHPESIVVVGGSNDIEKPGGKVLKNLIEGQFKGKLYVLNPKEDKIQGVKSYRKPEDLPETDLAIFAIAAKYTPDLVDLLARNKNTRAFIILSAGFSEESAEGKLLEANVVASVNEVGGSLIGPNCIGIITPQHHSVFTLPIPKLDKKGCDFISGSGATACFIMEAGIPKGLTFANVFSVGNSAQIGVEEIVKHMDETFDPENDSKIKLLYFEKIEHPEMLLKHASSLISKGCRIAAIKAGSSEAGSRAATSHTGALASPDAAVDALFRKAGIVRCFGREELISVASVFSYPEFSGKNIAIITHAGGPAVMLTDALSNNGFSVPTISGEYAEELKSKLFPGSSVSNPVDFLATGNAEQLGTIIDYVNEKFDNIDAMAVIFGTPGLTPIFDVYDMLDEKMKSSKKPIFPILPSSLTAEKEVLDFVSKGRIFFSDEVVFGNALGKIRSTPKPTSFEIILSRIDLGSIRKIIESADNGYLAPQQVRDMLVAANIPCADEIVATEKNELEIASSKLGFPLVMKVVGPVHKSDAGGVILNVSSQEKVLENFDKLIKIKSATGVLLQPMLSGTELFAGVKYEEKFGHMILFGLGGIFIEVLKDVRNVMAPLSFEEVLSEIKQLRSYKIIEGVRGKDGVDEELFADIIVSLSTLVSIAPEIIELDLNPLLGKKDAIIAVDARIRLQK